MMARIAGGAYLLTIACGLFAEVYVLGLVRVSRDPVRTAQKLRIFETLYRWGILADFLMLAAYAVVTVLLYRLLKPACATISLLAAAFSLLGLSLLAFASAMLLGPLHSPSLTYSVLTLHGGVYDLTGFFFGAYCLLVGWLLGRSRTVPVLIAWLMGLAGGVFCLEAILSLVSPPLAKSIPDAVTLISLVGEGSLAVWLALFGMGRPHILGQSHDRRQLTDDNNAG